MTKAIEILKKILDENGDGTMLADGCSFISILGLIDIENKSFLEFWNRGIDNFRRNSWTWMTKGMEIKERLLMRMALAQC